jgi:hypothetical protein
MPRLAYITWMKALGMMVIVYGHVAAWLPGAALPPILTKQLGVAFFVFIAAATLATDYRPARVIVVRRLFEVLVFTGIVAMLLSVIGVLVDGDLRESNYLPLLFGVNVLFDAFPANPTTWYVGTYTHLVLLSVIIRHWQPTWPQIASLATGEIAVRAALLWLGFRFLPYQLLTNWVTVYCLGRLWGRGDSAVRHWTLPAAAIAAATFACLSLPPVSRRLPFYLPPSNEVPDQLLISLAVTLLYVSGTLALAQTATAFAREAPRVIVFVAEHTPMIFIAHMPVYYALRPFATAYFGPWRAPILFLACILLPALASLLLRRNNQLRLLREFFVRSAGEQKAATTTA